MCFEWVTTFCSSEVTWKLVSVLRNWHNQSTLWKVFFSLAFSVYSSCPLLATNIVSSDTCHNYCWPLLLELETVSSTFPQKHNWHTDWSGGLLMLAKRFDTSLSALISSLNPLRCKAARRNLKHRVLGNCAVMTTLQQGYTGESEFYLLLKRARWESGVREKPAVPSSTRPTTQRLFHS